MLKKHITHLLVAASLFSANAAEPTPWEINLNANLMGSFQYYSKNWNGDEKGALSLTAQFNGEAQRQFNTFLHNRNVLKLSYGRINYQKENRSGFSDPVKSTDLVEFESVLKLTVTKTTNPFIAVRYVSQFFDESDSTKTYYFNPSQVLESFGGAVQLIKNKNIDLTMRLGGALRQTFFQNEGLDHTNDGGLEYVSELNASNRDGWIKFQSVCKIYEALATSQDKPDDRWRHPDVNWENTLNVNITKYLMLNVYMQLLYDKEIDLSASFKNVTSLGVTYMFRNNNAAQ